MSPWIIPLLIASLALLIPAAIVVGSLIRFGALVVSAGASAAAFAVFWFLLGGVNALYLLDGDSGPSGLVAVLVLLGGLLLMFAAWALALHASAQARLWPWVGLLTIAGVASFAAIIIIISRPDPCLFDAPSGFIGPICAESINPLIPLLLTAGSFFGPAAALAYGLGFRVAAPRPARMPPDGLTVSRLGTEDDGDSQFDMSTEPL